LARFSRGQKPRHSTNGRLCSCDDFFSPATPDDSASAGKKVSYRGCGATGENRAAHGWHWGLSTQQIYVNVRVGSFAAYLIKADAPVCLLFLQPVGRSPMSVQGQKATSAGDRTWSALPQIPDIGAGASQCFRLSDLRFSPHAKLARKDK